MNGIYLLSPLDAAVSISRCIVEYIRPGDWPVFSFDFSRLLICTGGFEHRFSFLAPMIRTVSAPGQSDYPEQLLGGHRACSCKYHPLT